MTILFVALLCMGTQCHKEEIEYKYNFIEKIDLSPTQKGYKIGDTIWIRYSNPDKRLFDNKSGNYIAADTVSVGFQVSFNSRYNAPVSPSGGFCDYVTANGVNVGRYLGDYGTGLSTTFGCNSNGGLLLTVGIVPKQKGIYSLDLLSAPESVTACANRSSGFPISTIEYRFNVTDGNKDVYLSIPPISRGESEKGYTESKIDSKQVYIVNVE